MLTLEDVLAATGGHILATSSPRSRDGRGGGEWEWCNEYRHQLRRLLGAGMAGRIETDEQARGAARGGRERRRLRGCPVAPDELHALIVERGLVPGALSWGADSADAVSWYVSAVCSALNVSTGRVSVDSADRPDPADGWPQWAREWLARMVCEQKRAYAYAWLECAYDDAPPPAERAEAWADKVADKIVRRCAAEQARQATSERAE